MAVPWCHSRPSCTECQYRRGLPSINSRHNSTSGGNLCPSRGLPGARWPLRISRRSKLKPLPKYYSSPAVFTTFFRGTSSGRLQRWTTAWKPSRCRYRLERNRFVRRVHFGGKPYLWSSIFFSMGSDPSSANYIWPSSERRLVR